MEWESITVSPTPIPAFYDLWTAKESIVKADGRGLNLDLRELKLDGNIEFRLETVHWHLRNIPLFADYACHIATDRIPTEIKSREISVSGIMDAYHCSSVNITHPEKKI